MTFKPWIPPAGEVVDPPVHPETTVAVIYSDGSESFLDRPARGFNWSGEGDGPKIIAYAVVEEYVEKREPWEGWIYSDHGSIRRVSDEPPSLKWDEVIHVREVLPEAPLDLTKITTPFGLLDEATQAALQAHGGPWQVWESPYGWKSAPAPFWTMTSTYRVAPSAAPAKPAPREVVRWAHYDDDGRFQASFDEEPVARKWLERTDGGTVVKLTGYL